MLLVVENEPGYDLVKAVQAPKNITTLVINRCDLIVVELYLPKLIKLDLSNNKITKIIHIPKTLKTCCLRNNLITENFADLSNLSILNLSSNKITDFKTFSPLSENCELNLACNKNVFNIPYVKSLSIEGVNLKNLSCLIDKTPKSVICSCNKLRSVPSVSIGGTRRNRIKCSKGYKNSFLENKIKDRSYSTAVERSENKFLRLLKRTKI
jgi:Leucine-rich repeat (LRR) protein